MKRWNMYACMIAGCAMLAACTPLKEADKELSGDVLLVVDMQNAYTEDGPWTCMHMDETAVHIKSLIDSGQFAEVIFTSFTAPEIPQGAWATYNEANQEVNEDKCVTSRSHAAFIERSFIHLHQIFLGKTKMAIPKDDHE